MTMFFLIQPIKTISLEIRISIVARLIRNICQATQLVDNCAGTPQSHATGDGRAARILFWTGGEGSQKKKKMFSCYSIITVYGDE